MDKVDSKDKEEDLILIIKDLWEVDLCKEVVWEVEWEVATKEDSKEIIICNKVDLWEMDPLKEFIKEDLWDKMEENLSWENLKVLLKMEDYTKLKFVLNSNKDFAKILNVILLMDLLN